MTSSSGSGPEPPSGRVWLVLHVKPRTEKKAMARLARMKGFSHLPTYVRVTRVQRRKVRRVLPLFPGYVFAHLSAEERSEIMRSDLVVRVLHDPNPRLTVRQLRQIAHATRLGAAVAPAPRTYREGDKVVVRYGPMRGTVGYVRKEGSKTSLFINVDILGSSVAMSISPDDVEPA